MITPQRAPTNDPFLRIAEVLKLSDDETRETVAVRTRDFFRTVETQQFVASVRPQEPDFLYRLYFGLLLRIFAGRPHPGDNHSFEAWLLANDLYLTTAN